MTNMEKLWNEPCDPNRLSALNLAFVGDSVFDLLTREKLICEANRPVKVQHTLAAKLVSAGAQAKAAAALLPELKEAERAVFLRGRNAHANHKAKNASESDYHYATGLEALFGWLYLRGDTARLHALFERILAFSQEETV